MVNKHSKRYSIPLIIRNENQNLNEMPLSLRWLQWKRQLVLVRMWRNWNLPALLVGMWNGVEALESRLAVPQSVKIKLPYGLAILFLDIFLGELKMYAHIKVCKWMFITSLFIRRNNVHAHQLKNGFLRVEFPRMECYSAIHEKERSAGTCNGMGYLWKYYAKWINLVIKDLNCVITFK